MVVIYKGENSRRNEYDDNNMTQYYKFYHRISKAEMEFASKKMRSGRALRPDDIPLKFREV